MHVDISDSPCKTGNPCLNGGTCKVSHARVGRHSKTGYYCLCREGFYGWGDNCDVTSTTTPSQ